MAAKRKTTHWEKPLAAHVLRELQAQGEDGARHLLGAKARTAPPKKIVAALAAYVDRTRKKKHPPELDDDHVLMLACTWGEQLCRALGYEWIRVEWKGGGTVAIVPADRAFVIYPMPYVRSIVTDANAENTILTLFETLTRDAVRPTPT